MSTIHSDPIYGRVARQLESEGRPAHQDFCVALRTVAAKANPANHDIDALVKTAAAAGKTRDEVMAQLRQMRARVTQRVIILPHQKCRPAGIDSFDARDVRYLSAMTGDDSDWTKQPYRSIRPAWMSPSLHQAIADAMPLVTSRTTASREALQIAVFEGFALANREQSAPAQSTFSHFAASTVNAVVAAVKAVVAPDQYAPLPDDGVTAETIANQSLGRVIMAKIITDCLEEQRRLLRPPKKNPSDDDLPCCRRLTFYAALRDWVK